jgi:ribosomal protein L18
MIPDPLLFLLLTSKRRMMRKTTMMRRKRLPSASTTMMMRTIATRICIPRSSRSACAQMLAASRRPGSMSMTGERLSSLCHE